MIYSGRIPYGINQVESSSLAITVENTDIAVFTTGSLLVSGSVTSLGGFTGSFSGSFTGSANLFSLTSSNALVTGNVIVLGTASINTLVVNQTQLSTGSNQLGDNADDFQTLYGTVRIPTGSLTVTGSVVANSFTGSFTGSVAAPGSTTQVVYNSGSVLGADSGFVYSGSYIGIGTSTPFSDIPTVGTGSIDLGNSTSNVTVGGFAVLGKTTMGGYGAVGSNYYLDNAGTLRRRNSDFFSAMLFDVGGFAFYSAGNGAARSIISTTALAVLNSSGNLTIGNGSTTLGARLGVKGSGTTSSTTALLIQNANASSSLVVRDDQVIILSGDTTTAAGTLPGGFFIRETYDGRSTYVLRMGETIGNDLFIGSNAASSYFLSLQANRKVRIGHYSSGTQDVEIGYNGTTNSIRNLRPSYFASGSYITGSVAITGSAGTGSALTVYKSGSTVMSIQGSQGELFSITDSLSGSLFSVSNISGLPILEVFSDNTTLIGNYLDPMLVTTQLVTANSGSTTVYSLPTASYDGAFYDYVVRSGSNSRAGQIMAIWSGSSVNYTDNSTTDFGSTANLSFNVIVSGSNMVLRSTVTTGSWTVKTIIRSI